MLQWDGGEFVFDAPKTKAGSRRIDFTSRNAALLNQHQYEQNKNMNTLGLKLSPNNFVFCEPKGTPYNPLNVGSAFYRVAEKADLPQKHRLHDLRNTHATLLLKQGVHPKVVSERLGHASVSITSDVSSHVLPGIQEQAALGFDEALK